MFYRHLSLFIAVSVLIPTVPSNLLQQQFGIHWTTEISTQALTARAGLSGRSSPTLITVTDLFEQLPHSTKTYGMLGGWRWLHHIASFFGHDTWVPLKIAPRLEELRYTVWPLVRHHFFTGWLATTLTHTELRERSAEKFADAHPYVLHVNVQKENRTITWEETNVHDRANLKRLNNATFDVFSKAMDSAFGTLNPWNSLLIIKTGVELITKIHSAHNWLVHEFGGSYAMTAYVHVADEEETEDLLVGTSYEVVGIRNPADADDTRFGLIPKDFKPTSKFVRVFSPSGSEVVSTDQIIYISREIGDLIEKESTDHLIQMGMDAGAIEAIRHQQPVTLQQVKNLWSWYQEPAERFEEVAERPVLAAPIIDAPPQPLEPETTASEPQIKEQPEPVATSAREVSQTDLNTFVTLAVRVLLRDAIQLRAITEKSLLEKLVEAGQDQARASTALKRYLSNRNILIEMVHAIYDVLKNSTAYTDARSTIQDPIATDRNSLFTFVDKCIQTPYSIESNELWEMKQIPNQIIRHLIQTAPAPPPQTEQPHQESVDLTIQDNAIAERAYEAWESWIAEELAHLIPFYFKPQVPVLPIASNITVDTKKEMGTQAQRALILFIQEIIDREFAAPTRLRQNATDRAVTVREFEHFMKGHPVSVFVFQKIFDEIQKHPKAIVFDYTHLPVKKVAQLTELRNRHEQDREVLLAVIQFYLKVPNVMVNDQTIQERLERFLVDSKNLDHLERQAIITYSQTLLNGKGRYSQFVIESGIPPVTIMRLQNGSGTRESLERFWQALSDFSHRPKKQELFLLVRKAIQLILKESDRFVPGTLLAIHRESKIPWGALKRLVRIAEKLGKKEIAKIWPLLPIETLRQVKHQPSYETLIIFSALFHEGLLKFITDELNQDVHAAIRDIESHDLNAAT